METEIIRGKLILFGGMFLLLCLLVIGAIMLDLWDGVHTARCTGVKVHSHKLRVTIAKMSEYWRFIMIGFLVDCIGFIISCAGTLFGFYIVPYVAMAFSLGLILVEVKSMFEHAKQRKSHIVETPQIIKAIIECAHEKDAQKILEIINAKEDNEKQESD